ncbi:MAG: DoxX-like family protein [Planctomycetes bacterium]|nr:DoxX-like family protein [Planctomycetota bacterium]
MKLTAETTIRDEDDKLWNLTQEPHQHARWDLRFTDISYLPKSEPDEVQRFAYVTKLAGRIKVEGWGETVAERENRGSRLRFGSDDWKSLIREGAGFWAYQKNANGVNFRTEYDYQVRYGLVGRIADRLLFRPLMQWATRWSFDRLRIWIEDGTTPELSRRLWLLKVSARVALGVVWILEGLLPKLLVVAPAELELVTRSGLVMVTPTFTLGLLGVAEIIGGAWLLFGKAERLAAMVAALAMLVIVGIVIAADPLAVASPFGGIVKNLGLAICSLVVLALVDRTPNASRANPTPRDKP